MATIPNNFIIQREATAVVTVQSGPDDEAAAEIMWSSTTDGNTVTTPDTVSSNPDQSDLLKVSARLDAAANEKQVVTITGTPNGGTFKLSYNGDESAAIAHNAANSAVEAALEALDGIGVGNVEVTGDAFPANPKTVEFKGDLAGTNVATLVVSDNSLSGGPTPAVAVSINQHGRSAK